jgi:hypothetical protein
MILTKIALKKINNPRIRIELAKLLSCSEQTIIRMIKKNERFGKLTCIEVIKKICLLTHLSFEKVINK